MKTEINLSAFKTGDMIFCVAKGFIDNLIVLFLNIRCLLYREPKIKCAHVGRILVLEGVPFMVEAIESGVEMMALETWFKRRGGFPDKYIIKRRTDPRPDFIYKSIAFRDVGVVNYDYSGTFIFSAWKVFFNVWIGEKGKLSSKAQYCTEMAARWDDDIFSKPEEISTRDLMFSSYYNEMDIQIFIKN